MAAGDEAAYVEFQKAYFRRLLRYVLVLTAGRQHAAEEALQLTLLRVVRHIRAFDSEESFWSWLTVLARSVVVDEERKRTRYLALLFRFLQRCQLEKQAGVDADSFLRALVERNVAELPADERDLLERKYSARQNLNTIAEATTSTPKAVEARLVRVRRKLRERILRQLNDENTIEQG
jgi:RNA polymerase sigma-70 factor (ECF subfamily)